MHTLILLIACHRPQDTAPIADFSHRRVLILGWDGTRPDAISATTAPTLYSLAQSGASTFQARTQQTSVTLSAPGWTSILTGVEAAKHQVFGNGVYDYKNPEYPSFLWRAHQSGRKTAVSTHWPDIAEDLIEPDALDLKFIGDDATVATTAAKWIETTAADVIFIQLDDVDHAGHASAFSPEDSTYMAAVNTTDQHSKRILDAVAARPKEEEWLVLATTDHGGDGANGHGGLNDACWTIYFFVSGPGIQAGTNLEAATQMDIAPTVLAWLGIETEASWGLDGTIRGF